MPFKPAKCPACGGNLRVPDDQTTVKCMYCGVDVLVREAIQLATARVHESTQAVAVKEKPLQGCGGCLGGCGGLMLIVAILATGSGLLALVNEKPYIAPSILRDPQVISALVMMFLVGTVLFIIGVVVYRGASEKIVGLLGECPYCATRVRVSPSAVGADCPACNRRIVVREMRFISVDTPVGVARKAEDRN